MINIHNVERFIDRHIGPDQNEIGEMLRTIKADSIEQLIAETVPANILINRDMNLARAKSEVRFLSDIRALAQKNKVFKSYIGLGYHDCTVPPVIGRNILENPGWYTAYTPYQAEIAQGRLEMLANFQTMVMDLTGMEIANASLLDEATAAAEAASMFFGLRKGVKKKTAFTFFADEQCLPQTLDVLKARTEPLGIQLVIGNYAALDLTDESLFGVLLQYPTQEGRLIDYENFIASASENDVKTVVAADLAALVLLRAPGEFGADAVVGTTQRFGVPPGFGGPHAGYFATRENYKRQIPGRIIGVSKDATGKPAYRMALQTREQHIRREKATSNICTAQVLLGVMSAAYAVYHGPEGLKNISGRIHGIAQTLASRLEEIGLKIVYNHYFDTIKIDVRDNMTKQRIRRIAEAGEMNFRYFDDHFVGISISENSRSYHIRRIVNVFAEAIKVTAVKTTDESAADLKLRAPQNLERKSDFLQHPVFNRYNSEHEMLRYLKRLENKDLSLVHSMISLGSCTMKLNATSEMLPVTFPEFSEIHPFAPAEQTAGYTEMLEELSEWLCEITGFEAMSLQPNSGAQGEFTGLMTIRAAHAAAGQSQRDIAIIPTSAHGTNPASAVLAGMKIILVKCDNAGEY